MINDNYKMVPDADVMYACDGKWWNWHADNPELKAFAGKKFTQDKEAIKKYGSSLNLNYIESIGKDGLSLDPRVIHQGSNSGYQAINLAYHFGAEHIILIGYDMKVAANGKAHWFGNHPDNVVSGYNSWIRFYETLAKHAEQIGLRITNCTIDSALKCFPKSTLEEIL